MDRSNWRNWLPWGDRFLFECHAIKRNLNVGLGISVGFLHPSLSIRLLILGDGESPSVMHLKDNVVPNIHSQFYMSQFKKALFLSLLLIHPFPHLLYSVFVIFFIISFWFSLFFLSFLLSFFLVSVLPLFLSPFLCFLCFFLLLFSLP